MAAVDSSGRILLGGIQGNSSTHRVRRLLNTTGFPDDPNVPPTRHQLRHQRHHPWHPRTARRRATWSGATSAQLGPAGGTLVTVPRLVLVNYDGTLNTTFNTNMQTIIGLGATASAPAPA